MNFFSVEELNIYPLAFSNKKKSCLKEQWNCLPITVQSGKTKHSMLITMPKHIQHFLNSLFNIHLYWITSFNSHLATEMPSQNYIFKSQASEQPERLIALMCTGAPITILTPIKCKASQPTAHGPSPEPTLPWSALIGVGQLTNLPPSPPPNRPDPSSPIGAGLAGSHLCKNSHTEPLVFV